MKWRRLTCLLALLGTALLLSALVLHPWEALHQTLPGADVPQRQLMRIWVIGAPGGGMSWLRSCLTDFERANPGVMTYVRQVSETDCLEAETLPDVILHMAGDLEEPEALFLPWTGDFPCDEALLRCGRWKTQQYGLPLCWSAWVLAIDSQWDSVTAATPAPTTLLGRPAATAEAPPTATPGYPAEKAEGAQSMLLASSGGGGFVLRQLLPEEVRKNADAAWLMEKQADVYQAFLNRKTASALLTTGQMTAFESLQRAGKGFAARMMTPETIITDQVWLAGLCTDTPAGRQLLAYLMSETAQRKLTNQGLYGVDTRRILYTDGNAALVEAAARRSLTAINAYIPAADVAQAAWQTLCGDEDIAGALAPLL